MTASTWRVPTVYGGLLRAELQAATAYRAQLVLWALAWVVPVAFMALWRGAAAGGAIAGITAAQFTTYYAILLVTTALQISRALSFRIEPLIESGELSALLLRPSHPLHPLVAQQVAAYAYRITPLFVVVPLLVWVLHGAVTPQAGQWVLAVAMALVGTAAEAYLGAMMGSVALWLTRSSGIRGLLEGSEWVFGGLVAPIALLPGILPAVARHLPLWFAIGAPAEAISGISTLSAWTVVEAAAWLAGLHLIFQVVWRRGMLRFEAVGT